jgi:2-succinyl-6-hydroxy-2,4-cyclohexadiene-1-carboxylate synthase
MLRALHGFTENDLTWREVLGSTSPGLICPLLPGHGWKPCPTTVSVTGLADTLAAQHLGSAPADICGYSMGGRLALALALRHPQRVRRLVLISSGPGFKDQSLQGTRRTDEIAMAETLEDDGLGPFVALWEKSPILTPFAPLPRTVVEDVRARRLNHDPLGLAAALRQLGAGAMPNLWNELSTLRVPTLLLAGEGDARYREVMAEMAQAIPGSRFEMIAKAGHGIHREQAEVLRVAVKNFLA